MIIKYDQVVHLIYKIHWIWIPENLGLSILLRNLTFNLVCGWLHRLQSRVSFPVPPSYPDMFFGSKWWLPLSQTADLKNILPKSIGDVTEGNGWIKIYNNPTISMNHQKFVAVSDNLWWSPKKGFCQRCKLGAEICRKVVPTPFQTTFTGNS